MTWACVPKKDWTASENNTSEITTYRELKLKIRAWCWYFTGRPESARRHGVWRDTEEEGFATLACPRGQTPCINHPFRCKQKTLRGPQHLSCALPLWKNPQRESAAKKQTGPARFLGTVHNIIDPSGEFLATDYMRLLSLGVRTVAARPWEGLKKRPLKGGSESW